MEMTSGYISDRSAGDSYSQGWQMFRANIGLFLGVVFVQILLSLPAQFSNRDPENINFGMLAFSNAWNFFVVTPIGMSTAWVYLRAARGDKPQFTDMFAVFQRNYINAIVVSILMGLIVGFGLLLFIIPGIYIAIRLSFVPYLIIDEQAGAIDALRGSWEMTKGHAGTIFVMFLFAIPIVLLGLIAFGVGVIVSSAVIASAYAIFYHSVAIQGKSKLKNDYNDLG